MRLSALLLSLVIGLGLTAPLEAKTKTPKAPKVHRSAKYKAPKQRKKPAKLKPMKFRKSKGSTKPAKAAKARKLKTRSV